jgi:hypothetical protein
MRPVVKRIAGLGFALVLILPLAAAAQIPDTSSGSTPVGRQGYQWQAEQAQEKEKLAAFARELADLSLDDWKGKALAWLELRPEGEEGAIAVPASFHVGNLQVKKAEVAALEAEGSWAVKAAKRKLPDSMTLVLTDVASTKVECPLRSAVADQAALIGVFLHEGVLRCVPRS